MPRTAEIIAVGSELLTGGVTNTNAAFLSRLLTAPVWRCCTTPLWTTTRRGWKRP